MLELHVRELRGDRHGRVHEAERGGEDDRAAGAGEALDGALGVRAFGDVFEKGGLDLVAEFLVDQLAADVMRLRPAAIGLGADIEEAGLDLVLRHCREGTLHGERRGQSEYDFLHLYSILCGFERSA